MFQRRVLFCFVFVKDKENVFNSTSEHINNRYVWRSGEFIFVDIVMKRFGSPNLM